MERMLGRQSLKMNGVKFQIFMRRSLVIGFLSATLLMGACMQKQAPAPVQPATPAMYQHKVKYSGETLGVIALYYTGKTANWQEILKANPGLKPERIAIGQSIQIPQAMLTRQDSMPEKFVRTFHGRKPSSAPAAPEATAPAFVPTEQAPVAETTTVPTEVRSDESAPSTMAPEAASTASTEAPASVEPATEPEPEAPAVADPALSAPETVPASPAPDKAPEDQERDQLLDELLSQ